MKIKELFKDNEQINIQNLLQKYNINDWQEFLKPTKKSVEDFMLYDNMKKGYDLIHKHINRRIYVLFDCDVDGYCSASILIRYLKQVNKRANIIPIFHKGKEHGLSDREVMTFLTQQPDGLLIIPDASGEEKECALLAKKGYEILCIDHHTNEPNKYMTMINAQFSEETLNKCGSGTATVYQFLRYLDAMDNKRYSKDLIDLVALGNIADDMSLSNCYNRAINYYGLRRIKNKLLSAMIEKFKAEPTPISFSFTIIPKINAVIRADNQELKEYLGCVLSGLTTVSQDDIDNLLIELEKAHRNQQNIIKKLSTDLSNKIDNKNNFIICEYNDCEPNYTGLLANNIAGKYQKPTVIIRDNGIGSMRSPVPILEIFNQSDSCDWCRGHDCAAGIKINDIESFKNYCNSLDMDFNTEYSVIKSLDVQNIPSYLYGYFDEFNEIFGNDLKEPLYHIYNIHINGQDIQEIGKSKTTIKFRINDIDFIKFFCSKDWKEKYNIQKDVGMNIEIIGKLQINEYEGNTKKQILIEEMEIQQEENNFNFDDLFS